MAFEVTSALLKPEDFKLDGPVKWCASSMGKS